MANLIISDDPEFIRNDELGLCAPAFRRFGASNGANVTIAQATPPESLDAIRDKINGAEMTADQIEAIIHDIAAFRYSHMEIAAYLISSASFMTKNEILASTKAMTSIGAQLNWDQPVIVDKHCIGGVPGNRTSMIVTPIVAAHGLHMPKTSSRAITSPAGTADTMEVLARIDVNQEPPAER